MCLLSIIIVSYNNKAVLIDCLDSVFRQNDIGEDLEVIVVEQSPNDDIFRYLVENYKWVNTIRAENRGFGAGNNRGFEVARGKYILFLNPDTILIEPICKFAVEKFENDELLGLFGVQLLDANGDKASSFDMNIPFGLWRKLEFKILAKLDVYLESQMYIQGADLFIRKGLFDIIGRFDENVFMYGEESDLCLRVKRAGFHISYDKSKQIVHLQGACSPVGYEKTFIRQLESFKYMCIKYRLPFNKIIRSESRYQKAKLLLLYVLGKSKSRPALIAREELTAINSFI